jgi:hypothetical protein
MSGRGNTDSSRLIHHGDYDMPDVLRDMMLQIRGAEAGKGKDMVKSFEPNLTHLYRSENSLYGEMSVDNSRLNFSFNYHPIWYGAKISISMAGESWEDRALSSVMLDSYMKLVQEMFPLCRENDLMCISDWFEDWMDYSKQDIVPQKHVLMVTEKQLVTIRIMKRSDFQCMEMRMKFAFMHADMDVVQILFSEYNLSHFQNFRENTPGFWTIIDPSQRRLAVAMGLGSVSGANSPLKNIESSLVRDFAYMSMKDGINPWTVDIDTPESQKVRVIYVIRAALEHANRQFERMKKGEVCAENRKTSKGEIVNISNALEKVNAFIDHCVQREHVECIPPVQETYPPIEPRARTNLCLTCGLRIRRMAPNLSTLSLLSSSPVPEVHPRQRAHDDAVEDLMQRVSLS